jgi:hypothetical protein
VCNLQRPAEAAQLYGKFGRAPCAWPVQKAPTEIMTSHETLPMLISAQGASGARPVKGSMWTVAHAGW